MTVTAACPSCASVLRYAYSNSPETPNTGDIAVCGECSTISVFNADKTLRPPNDIERVMMAIDSSSVGQSIRAAYNASLEIRKARR